MVESLYSNDSTFCHKIMAYCWNVVCYSKKESQKILKCIVSLSLVGKKKSYKYRENTVLLPEQCRLSGWGERHEIGAAPSLEALNLI